MSTPEPSLSSQEPAHLPSPPQPGADGGDLSGCSFPEHTPITGLRALLLGGAAILGSLGTSSIRTEPPEPTTPTAPSASRPAGSLHAPEQLERSLERITRRSIQYFLDNRTRSGLTLDRAPNEESAQHDSISRRMASIAATGYGMSALALAVEEGMLARSAGERMALDTLRYVESITPASQGGWIAHFIDAETGGPFPGSEISTIDTALFYMGAISAGEYFGGAVRAQVTNMFGKLDFGMILENAGARPGKLSFSHGFHTVQGRNAFLHSEWDHFSEGILVSLLALARDEIPVSVWEKGWDRSKHWEQDGLKTFGPLPLFTYYYPLGFLDLKGKLDSQGEDLWKQAQNAVKMQLAFCRANDYPENVFGLTACDGPNGYRAYFPGHKFGDKTIAPLAMLAAIALDEQAGAAGLAALERSKLLDGSYGARAAFDPASGWVAPQTLGIDVGSTLLMIDASRRRLIHGLTGKSEIIQKAMKRAGFQNIQ